MTKRKIHFKKLTANANTVFCQLNRWEQEEILDLLEHAMLVIAEACTEFETLRRYCYEPQKELGRGTFTNKPDNYNSVMSIISGMLKQHKATKHKNFTIHQLKNIEHLSKTFFYTIDTYLEKRKWPERINCENKIVFKEGDITYKSKKTDNTNLKNLIEEEVI